jgi:N-acetylmuramoyl-L-alanine amidase
VRELQERLISLGHAPLLDPIATFADGTIVAVEAFQHSRGLPITGVVDGTTWSRLVEAGWQPGKRLLYLTTPHQRGDDVAELQVHLGQLGFNPGRIDGIFGPATEHALTDFQRNCGLTSDGTLTRATLSELTRMTLTTTDRRLVNDARDLAGFDDATTGPVVLCGEGPLASLIASSLSVTFDVHNLTDTPDDDVARYANAHGATAVISLLAIPELNGIHLHYWASYHSHSRRGEHLASSVATGVSRSQQLPPVEVTGMALPIMRETTMTTLRIEHGRLSDSTLLELSAIISQIIGEVFHKQV